MKGDDLVSVIMPAFNPGRFIAEAVNSVVDQSFTDWELIIVDDGSGDFDSWCLPSDNRIRLVRQSNFGLSAARNVGVMESSGSLVAFLDADDVWLPTKLEEQFKAMSGYRDAVLSHCQMDVMDELGRSLGPGWGGGYKSYEELLGGCGVCVSSVVIRREILFKCGLFNTNFITAQDYDLWLKAARYGALLADPISRVRYRWHTNNLSQNFRRTYQEMDHILRWHGELALDRSERNIAQLVRHGVRRNAANFAIAATRSFFSQRFKDSPGRAAHDLVLALRRHPTAVLRTLSKIAVFRLTRLFHVG